MQSLKGIMWFFLGLLVGAAESVECPLYECVELPAGICANVTSVEDKTVEVTSLGCGTFRGCDITYIESALETGENRTLECTLYPPVPANYSDVPVKCPSRQSHKELVVGSHPRKCESNADCQVQDNTTLECICGVSRYKVCNPSLSDSLYEEFWANCQRNGDYMSEEFGYMWGYYYWNYPLMVSGPPCIDDVIVQLWMIPAEFGQWLSAAIVVLSL